MSEKRLAIVTGGARGIGREIVYALVRQGRRVAVFTSGGPLAVAAQRALALSDEMTMRLNWQVVNCSMSRFKCTSETMMLASFNEHDWLRDGNDATLVTYR